MQQPNDNKVAMHTSIHQIDQTELGTRIDNIRQQLAASRNNRTKNDLLLRIIELSKPINALQEVTQVVPLLKCLRKLLVDKEQAIRSQGYRVLRYLLTNKEMFRLMMSLNIDLLIARSLERDAKYLWERMQALKLVRRMMGVDSKLVSRSLVQSLVSIADSSKDDFRRVCLDALRELVLINPEIVATCNGIRTIINSILDPACQDISGSLTLTLLFLLDRETTRRYIRSSSDILKLLAVFTDTESPNTPEKEATRAAAHKALVTIMRSWTGILCLTSDSNGLRSLVQLLGLPSSVEGASRSREAIFDLIFEIMHVVKSHDLRSSRRVLGGQTRPNLLHSYIVMVLLALIDCGLIDMLTTIGMRGDPEFAPVATTLLTEILRLSSDLLPRSVCAALNALPGVVEKASTFGPNVNNTSRVRAINMITGLSRANLAQSSYAYNNDNSTQHLDLKTRSRFVSFDDDDSKQRIRPRPDNSSGPSRHRRTCLHGIAIESSLHKADVNATSFSLTRQGPQHRGRNLNFLRHHIDTHVDEAQVQTLLRDSNVLQTKDFKSWDFRVCLQLLEGPLTTPAALVTALKTKFIKRLLSFLKPEKKLFSELDWTVPNMIIVRVACQLFRVMLACPEGRDCSYFGELVGDIFTALLSHFGIDPKVKPEISLANQNMISPRERKSSRMFTLAQSGSKRRKLYKPFARDNITRKLSREYFSLIAILLKTPHGQGFVDKYHLYDNFYMLHLDQHLDYLNCLILSHLDYSAANPSARALLANWMKDGSPNLRKFAISHLRLLLRQLVAAGVDSVREFEWALCILVDQLVSREQDADIALCALAVLEEACAQGAQFLDFLISRRPKFDLVGRAANNLQLTFLGTERGVDYLNSLLWIKPAMMAWRDHENQRYVELLENSLVTALNAGPAGNGSANDEKSIQDHAGLASTRSDEDDYFFERVHSLPWSMSIVVEYPKGGRHVRLISPHTYVHTSYEDSRQGWKQSTWVVGVVLDVDGCPQPYKIDYSNITLRATLSMGADPESDCPSFSASNDPYEGDYRNSSSMRKSVLGGSSDANRSSASSLFDNGQDWTSYFVDPARQTRTCPPGARANLGPERPYILGDMVRWNFEFGPPEQDGNPPKVYLKSVWFLLPPSVTARTVVPLEPHLYGELSKTAEGCLLLQGSGYIDEFVEIIKAETPLSIQKRAALWTIGQIGSSSLGFELLEESDIVQYISEQAQSCSTLSMRGTCFYVLGLLSRSSRGRSELAQLGWQFSPHAEAGIVIPKDVDRFLTIPPASYSGSWAAYEGKFGIVHVPAKNKKKNTGASQSLQDEKESKHKELQDKKHRGYKVLGHISNLCNHVTQKSSLGELRKLRSKHKEYFCSPTLLFETFKIMSHYTFRLPARRFVLFDLFSTVQWDSWAMSRFNAPFDRIVDANDLVDLLREERAHFRAQAQAHAQAQAQAQAQALAQAHAQQLQQQQKQRG